MRKDDKDEMTEFHYVIDYSCNGGRYPSKYSDAQIEAYAEKLIEWIKKPTSFLFKEFCVENDIPCSALQRMADKNCKFALAYERARDLQEVKIMKGSLLKKFDSSTSLRILSCEYGLREKNDAQSAFTEEQTELLRRFDQAIQAGKFNIKE